jgi:hypothetical protein
MPIKMRKPSQFDSMRVPQYEAALRATSPAHLVTLSAYYNVDAARCSRLCIRSASLRTEVNSLHTNL